MLKHGNLAKAASEAPFVDGVDLSAYDRIHRISLLVLQPLSTCVQKRCIPDLSIVSIRKPDSERLKLNSPVRTLDSLRVSSLPEGIGFTTQTYRSNGDPFTGI